MNKKVIAIIPARGGSKRIPKKNIKDFFGKPLIAYSIETALKSGIFDEVIVSTDDKKIAAIAKKYGATVPFIRPKELSDDFSDVGQVVNHTIEYLKENGYNLKYVCTIYATAPLLDEKYLLQGYEYIKNDDIKYSFGATSMPFPIQRTFKLDNNNRCEMFNKEHFYTRSQDLEEAYYDAGQFFWQNLDFKSSEIVFGKDSKPVIIPRYLVQDLDTQEDWERLEMMYRIVNENR